MGRSTSTSLFRELVISIVAILVAMYTIFVRQYDFITSQQAFYGTLIVMLGAIPLVVTLLDKREAGLIPLMPLHGIFYALTFGIPVFSNKMVWLTNEDNEITAALVLSIFGLVCLYLGYYSFRTFYRRLKPIRSNNIPVHLQITTAWILFGVFMLFEFFPILKTLPSVEQLSTPLSYLSLGILALLAFSNRLPRTHFLLFTIAVTFTLMLRVLSGSLAPAIFLIVFLGILYWNQRQRIPLVFIALSIAITLLLNPVKFMYREIAWQSAETASSYSDKGILLSDVLQEYYSTQGLLSTIDEDSSTINRLAHISVFSYVIGATPTYVPYWSGDSYHTLWTSFIPRALWQDKPHATIGQDFGHRYSLIAPYDEWTSLNLPWLIEFYANFGTFGVLAGMFFIGVFFGILVHKLRVPATATIEHALAVTVIFSLFYAESNLALMVGGIFSTYIALIVLLHLLTSGRAVTSSDYVRRMP